MKKLLVLLLAVFFGQFLLASQTTATSSGDWQDAIWSNGEPGCIDTIYIPVGITVDITSTIDLDACADSIIMFISGSLVFQNGKKLKLPCDSDVIVEPGGSVGVGSGGGSSTYIEICGTQYWNASSGDLTGPAELCDGGCPPTPLPIELLYFTAELEKEQRKVDLKWATASESDNLFFTIERSIDAINWEFVTTQDGAINSSITIVYEDIDQKPYMGVSYYRLKQTDVNGDHSYSPIVSVNQTIDSGLLVYYDQNAGNGSIVITFPNSAIPDQEVMIYDFKGALMYQNLFDISESNQCIVPINPAWESGAYIIRTSGEATKLTLAK